MSKRRRADRRRAHAERRGCRATLPEAERGPDEQAPTKTPGQRRTPTSMSAAIAMPLGGQTNVANPATASNARPSCAAATYRIARPTFMATSLTGLVIIGKLSARTTLRYATIGQVRRQTYATAFRAMTSR
jgi:hypothetical protein